MKRRSDEVEGGEEGSHRGYKERRTHSPEAFEEEKEERERDENVEDSSMEDDPQVNQRKPTREDTEIETLLIALETHPEDPIIRGAARALIKKMYGDQGDPLFYDLLAFAFYCKDNKL